MNADDQTVVWYHVVGTTAEPPSYTWTWNGAVAGPAGGITAWRGVSKTTPFDVPAVVATGTGLLATAPVITTLSANAQLISVFGSGGATGLSFALPANESGAVKVNGGPQSVSWYAHLLSDKPQRTVGATLATKRHPHHRSSRANRQRLDCYQLRAQAHQGSKG